MTTSPAEDLRTSVHLERAVTLVLRVGVVASSAVLATGTVLTLVSAGSRRAASSAVSGLRRGTLRQHGWPTFHTVGGVVGAAVHGQGPGLVMLGVLLLVATPVVRVAVSVVGFLLERDRRFVLVTALVLGVLVGSFALG